MRLGARKLSFAGLFVLVGLMASLLAACGGSSSGGTKASDANQVLKYPLNAASSDIATLDPAQSTDYYSYQAIYLIFPGLVVLNDQQQIVPWAASAQPTVSDGGLTYTYHIRPGLKFSDGEPIDANAYAYSINRALSPCTAAAVAYYLAPIKDFSTFNSAKCNNGQVQGSVTTLIGDSIIVSDPQTISFKLSQPYAYFSYAMTYPITYAVPQKLIQQYGDAKWIENLSGFGGSLFKLKTWDHKGNVILERNDSFWGQKPTLREIDMKVYKDPTVLYNDFQAGQLDFGIPSAAQYGSAKNYPSSKGKFNEIPSLANGYLQFNWSSAPFDDVRVRQAFSLAINRQQLADKVWHGSQIPTYHIVPAGMPGYDKNLTQPDGTTQLTGDTAKAQDLAKAYAAEKCGGNYSGCPAITLTVPSDTDNTNQAAALQQTWQSVFPGWKVNVQAEEFNTLYKQAEGGQLQAFVLGWIADYPDPQDWLSLQFGSNASNNLGNVKDATANALMDKADVEQNSTTRYQEYNQAEQELVNQVAWASLVQQKVIWVNRNYVHNLNFNSLGVPGLTDWQAMYVDSH